MMMLSVVRVSTSCSGTSVVRVSTSCSGTAWGWSFGCSLGFKNRTYNEKEGARTANGVEKPKVGTDVGL